MSDWQTAQRIHNAAFLNAQVVCALADIEAMKATNAHLASCSLPPAYKFEDFAAVPNKYGIHHNAALETLGSGL